MTIFIVIILAILAMFLYNNGKNHTLIDPDIHRYNFAETDSGEWVSFPTVFKLTGDNNIIIQTPDETLVILDVVEIEPNKFTGTLSSFKVFTTVFMGDRTAYLRISGGGGKTNYKK